MLIIRLSVAHLISNNGSTFNFSSESSTWPAGTYALPMADSGCPEGSGFNWYTGHRTEELERDQNENKHSPSIHLRTEIGKPEIKRYFCVKNSTKADEGTTGSVEKRVSLPVNKPFYLLAFESTTCQEVRGAVYALEYVVFDTENSNNQDARAYPYPYGANLRQPTIYYCYYRGKAFFLVFNKESEQSTTYCHH